MRWPCTIAGPCSLWGFFRYAEKAFILTVHDLMTVTLENDTLHEHRQCVTSNENAVPWMMGESGFKAALERVPGVVYALDPIPFPPRLLYVSPKVEVLLGYAREHWLREPGLWLQVIHPEDRERVLKVHTLDEPKRQTRSCEYRMRACCGRVVWVSDSFTPVFDPAGKLLGMQGLWLDVTERRHAEMEMREWHEEMERLVELQVAAQTAAAIAHELNQPLNAIASYHAAALRLLRAGNPHPERLLHALEQGALQVQRAGQVMRDLLALLHKGESPSEGVYLNAAVREAVSILVEDGYIDGVKAEIELMPELPRVQANRLQVQKVLVNLLRNAVEAIHGSHVYRGCMHPLTFKRA